jgi:hypothetical protein
MRSQTPEQPDAWRISLQWYGAPKASGRVLTLKREVLTLMRSVCPPMSPLGLVRADDFEEPGVEVPGIVYEPDHQWWWPGRRACDVLWQSSHYTG